MGKAKNMATTSLFTFVFNQSGDVIQPGGTLGIWIGPLDAGAVAVTAHTENFVTGNNMLEVIKVSTRIGSGGRFLDVTVRNIGSNSIPYTRVMVSNVT